MRRQNRRRLHRGATGLPNCLWCERPAPPQWAAPFEMPDGQIRVVHPDCHSIVLSLPEEAHWLPGMFKGKRPSHTCGNDVCINPEHLVLVDL